MDGDRMRAYVSAPSTNRERAGRVVPDGTHDRALASKALRRSAERRRRRAVKHQRDEERAYKAAIAQEIRRAQERIAHGEMRREFVAQEHREHRRFVLQVLGTLGFVLVLVVLFILTQGVRP